MLSVVLNEYGKSLIESELVQYGVVESEILYDVIMNDQADVIKVNKLSPKEKIIHPIGVYDFEFSDSDPNHYKTPYYLVIKMGYYFDSNKPTKDIMRQNLMDICDFCSNEKLRVLRDFLIKDALILDEFGLDPDMKAWMMFSIATGDKTIEPIVDEKVIEIINEYQKHRIHEGNGKEFVCSISGRISKYVVNKHSQIFPGLYKPRILTSECNETHYGEYANNNVQISAETEMYIRAAAYNIQRNKEFLRGRKIYFLGCMGMKEPICLFERMKNISSYYKRKKDIFYVEYDTINRGRVSTYNACLYSEYDAEKIISNIEKWNVACWDEVGKYELLPKAYVLFGKIYPQIDKLSSYWDDKVSLYVNVLMHGQFVRMVDMFYLPYLLNCENKKTRERVIKGVIKLMAEESKVDTVDFRAGQLLALAVIIEERAAFLNNKDIEMTYAESRMKFYQSSPWKNWVDIRARIDNYLQNDKTPIGRMLYRRLIELNYELLSRFNFLESQRLSAAFLVGYDFEMEYYWKLIGENKDLREEEKDD